MSRYNTQAPLSQADDQLREQVVFRYTARYGQHPETQEKYRDAIMACQSIDNLPMTVTQIARMYQLNPECLRNQLKRHYPEILSSRTELRAKLGYKDGYNFGLKDATVQKYAQAIELLRDPAITVREAAARTGVSYQGLQQHLLFYHKDIADARMLTRADSLLRPLVVGDFAANGGLRLPRPEAVARYAPAVELYRTTSLPMTEIARRCDLSIHNLASYLRRWHRPLMEERREKARYHQDEKKRAPQINPSRMLAAERKYLPAIDLITEGKSLSQAANTLNVSAGNLRSWLKLHHPEILSSNGLGMMRLPSGKMVSRKSYHKYEPIAAYINSHPTKPTREVARKWQVPESSLFKSMSSYFPEIWERHCRLSAKKAEKEREKAKQEKMQARQLKEPSRYEITQAKYAACLADYATGKYQIREVALMHGVGEKGLSHHIHRYHPGLILNRKNTVTAAIQLRKDQEKKQAQANVQAVHEKFLLRQTASMEAAREKYAPAVALYRDTDMTLKAIARQLGLKTPALVGYLKLHHRDLMRSRQEKAQRALDEKYKPAVDLITSSGLPVGTVAKRLGFSRHALNSYLQKHHPDLHEDGKPALFHCRDCPNASPVSSKPSLPDAAALPGRADPAERLPGDHGF